MVSLDCFLDFLDCSVEFSCERTEEVETEENTERNDETSKYPVSSQYN